MIGSAVVVGGGLSGAAAAWRLARAGRPVILIERQATEIDKICGEFLSREAQLHLRLLGIDPRALGGHPITHLRLIHDRVCVRVALPFAGIGLSRRRLDEAVMQQAVDAGAVLLRGQAGRLSQGAVVVPGYELPVGGPILLATGKHDLHENPRLPPKFREDLVGFKAYFRLTPREAASLAGHVEVILFRDGYAGLQNVEGARANLCLLVQRSRLQRVGFSWERLLDDLCNTAPHLRQRLDGAVAVWDKPLSIYRVPYGFVHQNGDALYHLGDQMGVIDSFSGDGMSIALHSAAVAAQTIVAGQSARAYHRAMRADIGRQIKRARWLYHVGQTHSDALMRVARFWPGSLRLAAALTRVPERALMRALPEVSVA
jgi:flavin-dependent dehydrogenase